MGNEGRAGRGRDGKGRESERNGKGTLEKGVKGREDEKERMTWVRDWERR